MGTIARLPIFLGLSLLLGASVTLAACQDVWPANHQDSTTVSMRQEASTTPSPSEASEGESPGPMADIEHVGPSESIPLDNPRGVAIGQDGEIYVADSGDPSASYPGRVLRISPTGEMTPYVAPFSASPAGAAGGIYVTGLSDVAVSGDILYVLLGAGAFLQSPLYAENHLIAIRPNGKITDQFNARMFESEHNPDGAEIDSNAAGVAVDRDRVLWITDAAGNWVAQLVPSKAVGDPWVVSVVTTFPDVSGEDAVPTGIAVGPDGNAYVALFRCQEPTRGKGGIARVEQDGTYEIVVSGLSNPIDVAFDPSGQMYVLEFAVDYAPRSGRLIRIGDDGDQTTVLDGLMYPTGVAFDPEGNAYITEMAAVSGGAAGTGKLLRFNSVGQ